MELLHPTPAEVADRQAAVDQVADAVTSIWPHATVQVFGSFATGGRWEALQWGRKGSIGGREGVKGGQGRYGTVG